MLGELLCQQWTIDSTPISFSNAVGHYPTTDVGETRVQHMIRWPTYCWMSGRAQHSVVAVWRVQAMQCGQAVIAGSISERVRGG